MGFAENLQKIRKEKRLSQEELAELVDVSRQAVSRWEQGTGYPEVEKLLAVARVLGTTLDGLMAGEAAGGATAGQANSVTGVITVCSPHEGVVARCGTVMSSPRFRGGRRSPRYALFAVRNDTPSFFGPQSTFLGWYADGESLEKDVAGIREAIAAGEAVYELRYSARVERSLFRVRLRDTGEAVR